VAVLQVGSRENPLLEGLRLGRLLSSSLSAVFFSLVPYVCTRLIADEALAWRTSSALFLVASVALFLWVGAKARTVVLETGHGPPASVTWIVLPLGVLPIPLLLANVLGLFGQRMAAVYEASILMFLCAAGFAFVRTVGSLIACIGEVGRG